MLARLWHAPSVEGPGKGDPVGTAAIGSSEAIMLGGEGAGRLRGVRRAWDAALQVCPLGENAAAQSCEPCASRVC